MIIYEVNCLVDQQVVQDFAIWLRKHVDEIIALEGFTGAEVLELLEDDRMTGAPVVGFSVRYQLSDQKALDHYLSHYAPAFRKDGMDRFGQYMTAYRRVLSATSPGAMLSSG